MTRNPEALKNTFSRPSLVALVVTLSATTPGFAIVNGVVDAEGVFPNVGALVAIRPPANRPDTNVPQAFCSGSLVHPRVLLTAGHCLEFMLGIGLELDDVRVSFDPDAHNAPSSWYEIEDIRLHPDFYSPPAGFMDVGVVILKEPVLGVAPVALPDPFLTDFLFASGELDHTPDGGTPLLIAGYGAEVDPPLGADRAVPDGLRRWATSEFRALAEDLLHTAQNFSQDLGGIAPGDSGCPIFWVDPDGKRWQIGVLSFGDGQAASEAVYVRADLPAVPEFLIEVIDQYCQ
jgi:hypothetical protein